VFPVSAEWRGSLGRLFPSHGDLFLVVPPRLFSRRVESVKEVYSRLCVNVRTNGHERKNNMNTLHKTRKEELPIVNISFLLYFRRKGQEKTEEAGRNERF
jgi:hypothetical protein